MLFSLIGKSLLARPLRYVLTGLSIVFGVAAVTAVFVFTDGLRTTFDDLGANIQSGFDVAIQSDSPFGDGTQVPPVPASLRDQLAEIEGVVAVQPRIGEFGVVAVDGDGESIVANGPNLGINWESETPNPRLFIEAGRAPTGPNEFAIDVGGFEAGVFEVGGTYNVIAPAGRAEMELVGTYLFGSDEENAAVGAILLAFEEDFALEFLNNNEGYDDITVVLDRETSEVLPAIEALIAQEEATLVAIDQEQLVEDQQEGFGQIAGIFQTILLVFAFIILSVVVILTFLVFNITLGQRIKELGLLRSVGALGSQITNMMLGEAFLLGAVATILGIPAGLGLAALLRAALEGLGFPGNIGLPLNLSTVIAAILVGIGVTMIAALFPAIKARQVTPMAALRGTSLDDLTSEGNFIQAVLGFGAAGLLLVLAVASDGWLGLGLPPALAGLGLFVGFRGLGPRFRMAAQVSVLVLGLILLTFVRFSDMGLGATFGLLGAGAFLTLIGASQVSSLVAAPVSRMLGSKVAAGITVVIGALMLLGAAWLTVLAVIGVAQNDPAAGSLLIPAALVGTLGYGLVRTAVSAFGLTGQLARENAARSPSRTATTATALMIGLALVTAVTVIGDSIKSSVSDALGSSITSDWLIQGPQNGPTGLPFNTEVADRILALPEVDQVVPYRFGFAAFVSLQGIDAADAQAALPRVFQTIEDRDDPLAMQQLQADLGITDISVNDTLATDFASVQAHIDPDFVELDPSADPATSIWIESEVATEGGISMGDTFPVVFLDGSVVELTVTGIFDDGFVFGERVIDNSLWDQHLASDSYGFITATTTAGVEAEVARAAINDEIGGDYPLLEVNDRSEVQAEAESQIDQTLATVNVLLMLSGLVAVLGISIALSLAVFERTREIGLLRAVGTTRQQIRRMVRWEGVIVAAFGGVVGVVVGIGLGILATQKLPEFLVSTVSIPPIPLVSYILGAAIVGLGAGAFPAIVAGKMNVLDAISSE